MSNTLEFPAHIFNPSDNLVRDIAQQFGTPCYVSDEGMIRERIRLVREMPMPYEFQPRFAMKSCPLRGVLKIFRSEGFLIDASSAYEAERALLAGYKPEEICLTAQELPTSLGEFMERGFDINACSLRQLSAVAKVFSDSPSLRRPIGVRINPGLGSGHSGRVATGGVTAGFGIWHDYIPEILRIAENNGITISRIHSHIGAGTDPEVWERCAAITLHASREFKDATTISFGGGFKVARVHGEEEADLQEIGTRISRVVIEESKRVGKRYKIEVEPGTYLSAATSAIIATIQDIVDTGELGHRFIKLDAGMTEIIRPAMYGSQHPIRNVPIKTPLGPREQYLVIGHCCESGDVLTVEPGNPEAVHPRDLARPQIGDLCVIGATGAYTAGFSAVNYNSYPECAHVLVSKDGTPSLIKRRQTVEQMLQNEIG